MASAGGFVPVLMLMNTTECALSLFAAVCAFLGGPRRCARMGDDELHKNLALLIVARSWSTGHGSFDCGYINTHARMHTHTHTHTHTRTRTCTHTHTHRLLSNQAAAPVCCLTACNFVGMQLMRTH